MSVCLLYADAGKSPAYSSHPADFIAGGELGGQGYMALASKVQALAFRAEALALRFCP